jgi:hypothetical protein
MYFQLFKQYLISWNNENKYLYGVNWLVSMEVAIRAINIIVAANYFKIEIQNDEEFEKFLSVLIQKHGEFILRNLEYKASSLGNNHLLSDFVGLFIISNFIKSHPKSKHWEKKSICELNKILSYQILNDGLSFENSVPYHRLVLELIIFYVGFGIDNHIQLSREFLNKFNLMFHYVKIYIDDSGNAPQVGDNDSGRVLNVGGISNNHAYLLHYWKYFLSHKVLAETINDKNVIRIKNFYYFNAGRRLVFKNSQFRLFFVVESAPCNTTSSHSHFDTGSFVLSINGVEFFVDLGTYSYTKDIEERNKFRSLISHNLPIPEDIYENKEYNLPKSAFKIKNKANCELKFITENSFQLQVTDNLNKFTFNREIICKNYEITIKDKIIGSFVTIFHLNSKARVKPINEFECIIELVSTKIKMKTNSKIQIIQSEYSPNYLEKLYISTIIIKGYDFIETNIRLV